MPTITAKINNYMDSRIGNTSIDSLRNITDMLGLTKPLVYNTVSANVDDHSIGYTTVMNSKGKTLKTYDSWGMELPKSSFTKALVDREVLKKK